MLFWLNDSQTEARRAIQCFLSQTGDPGYVYRDEEYVPPGNGVPDGQGGFLKTAIYSGHGGRGARTVRILLHKKEWDRKQQFGRLWWRAVRLQYLPNRDYQHNWAEFELKPVEFGAEGLFGWELRFKYELVPVEATRQIEVTA